MATEYAPEVIADLNDMTRHGLSAWGLPTDTRVTLLNLSENATFLLEGAHHEDDLVLRLHRVGYSSVTEIRSELAWIEALSRDGIVETAPPVAGIDGEFVQTLSSPTGGIPRQAVAFRRVPGKEPDHGDDLPRWFRVLGGLTAQMHQHSRQWRRPAYFTRKLWDLDAMVGEHAYWGPWRAALGLTPSGAAILERTIEHIGRRLSAYGMSPERFGLVHADLRLANLLVEHNRLRVIDFDDCGLSWFVYDFAAAISFIEHEPFIPELQAAWIDGYRGVAPLAPEDEAEIPTFIILRRILLTAWLASHAEIPFARERGANFTAGTVTLAETWLARQG